MQVFRYTDTLCIFYCITDCEYHSITSVVLNSSQNTVNHATHSLWILVWANTF